jgi:hypothetical protein
LKNHVRQAAVMITYPLFHHENDIQIEYPGIHSCSR